MTRYAVNECFASPQGEGVRAGTANVFLRLSGCNLRCNGAVEGEALQPICDTEFESGRTLDLAGVLAYVAEVAGPCRWVILTGGEPGLQADRELVDALRGAGYQVAIETNGTVDVSGLGLDWITVSPKVAEHALKQLTAHEVKYVRGYGQGIPRTRVKAAHQIVSPAFEPDPAATRRNVAWCVRLVMENPEWRLSVQQHKAWAVR